MSSNFSSPGSTGSTNTSRSAVFAAIGDSQILNGNTTGININSGIINMAAQFTRQKIYFPPGNNVAIGGTQLASIYATLPTALALKPDFLVFDGGTNNIGNTTVASAKTTLYSIIRDTLNAGVIPIFVPITPRTFSWSASFGYFIEIFNRAVKELGYGRPDLVAAAGLPPNKLPYILDESKSWDYASTIGGFNPGWIGSDGLHWAYGAGVSFGAQIADIVNSLRPGTMGLYTTSPYDVYDATNNPTGSLISIGGVNRGLFAGTTGSKTTNANPTSLTPTGNVATNWEITRFNGSSTSTMVGSKDDPRSDGFASGARQRIQINSTTNGDTQEQYFIRYQNGISGVATGFAAGDVVVFECAYQIASAVNLLCVSAVLAELGPASPQSFIDGNIASGFATGISSAAFPDLLRPGLLRTPPMTLQAGVTNLFPRIAISMYAANSATTPASLDIYLSDAKLFKVQ